MKLFKKEPDFKLMEKRMIAFAISGLIILAGLITFFAKGAAFNYSIEFTGGTLIEADFNGEVTEDTLRDVLGHVDSRAVIQRVGQNDNKFFIKTVKVNDEIIRAEDREAKESANVVDIVKKALTDHFNKGLASAGKADFNLMEAPEIADVIKCPEIPEATALKIAGQISKTGIIDSFDKLDKLATDSEDAELFRKAVEMIKAKTYPGNVKFLSTESVGPQVGYDLRRKAVLATVLALIGMLVYIAFRFKFIYGLAAVITLFHDIMISLSVILFFNIEVSLSVVAALLTIVGYSLNDTIVIFDRVRDNVTQIRKGNAETVLDTSINQTLSRTIVTSGTTLLTVLALFFFGGEVIHMFSLTLIVGVIVGTYSSIFQSCAWLKIWEKYFLGKKKA